MVPGKGGSLQYTEIARRKTGRHHSLYQGEWKEKWDEAPNLGGRDKAKRALGKEVRD